MHAMRAPDSLRSGLAQPEITHLALLDEARHCADRVLDRHGRIDAVLVVEIDDIDAEPLEALIARDRHIVWPPVGQSALAAGAHVAELGGDDRAIAPVMDRTGDQLLVLAVAVDVGRVAEVDAELDARMHRAHALLVVGSAIVTGKAGASHADSGDLQPLSAQLSQFHCVTGSSTGHREVRRGAYRIAPREKCNPGRSAAACCRMVLAVGIVALSRAWWLNREASTTSSGGCNRPWAGRRLR